jgi:hypothetical protein
MDYSAYEKLVELSESSPPYDFSSFDKDVMEAVAEDLSLHTKDKEEFLMTLMDYLGWD